MLNSARCRHRPMRKHLYTLYGGRYTRALLVEMVMLEGEIDYQLREVDIVQQEHRSVEFLSINPAGHVPAMITPEGVTLYETPAINLYLVEHHGLTDLAPTVDEPDRGPFLSRLFFLAGDLEPVMKRYFYPHRYVLRDEDTPIMKEESLRAAVERFAVIEERLGKVGPYYLGTRFLLVDLTLSFWACNLESEGLLNACPAVRNCVMLVKQRPKLRSKFSELELWREEYRALQARGEGVR